MKKFFKSLSIVHILSVLFLFSCNDITFDLPHGPEGKKGDNGLTAYEVWKDAVLGGSINWPEEQVDVVDFFAFLKGEKGDDGKSSYELWVEYIASGIIENPHNPEEIWPPDKNSETDYWNYIVGRDGRTPHVGENGNWWIGTEDTGVSAKGAKGDKGDRGSEGKSAYEVWVQQIESGIIDWPTNQTSAYHFFLFLKGKDGANGQDGANGRDGTNGRDGANGSNGSTPVIIDGYWWVDGANTYIPATGADGKDGATGADGSNGSTPEIQNGTWWIDGVDTGIPATGPQGKQGKQGEPGENSDEVNPISNTDPISPHIGENGNWWIGTTDTGTPATGPKGDDGDKGDKGDDGAAGLSAYELWVKDLKAGKINDQSGNPWPAKENSISDFYRYLTGADGADGTNGTNGKSAYALWKEWVQSKDGLPDPKNPKTKWPTNKVSEEDFLEYLSGADGKNGANGKDGEPGAIGSPGATVEVMIGRPNVIAQYSQIEYGEYVRTKDGGVLYLVYDDKGNLAKNATVKDMPGIIGKEYKSDENGQFIIPKEELPNLQAVAARWGSTKVTIDGTEKESASNTYVPNRVKIKLELNRVDRLTTSQTMYFTIFRKMNPDDEWESLPSYLPGKGSLRLKVKALSKEGDINSSGSQEIKEYGSPGYCKITLRRPMLWNEYGSKNGYTNFWNTKQGESSANIYYTCMNNDQSKYYGEDYKWKGYAELPPIQIGPVISQLKLYNETTTVVSSTESYTSFGSCEGALDFSRMDFNRIYNPAAIINRRDQTKDDSIDKVTYKLLSETEAKERQLSYVDFDYTLDGASKDATSKNNASSFNVNSFAAKIPYLGSSIYVKPNNQSDHITNRVGTLILDGSKYKISKNANFSDVDVTYGGEL